MNRRLAALAIASIVALPTSAARAAATGHPLRVAWVYAMANAPAVIAEKKGFYAAEGLDVELTQFNDGPVIQQAVAAGEVDVAYVGAPPVYQWFSRGLDARILAKVNWGQAALIASTAATPPIATLADLRGRRIAGVAKGSGMDVLLRGEVLTQRAGFDPDRDVTIVNMPAGNMAAALDRKLVDGAFTWEPFVSEAVLRGTARVVLDVNQAVPHYPWYVIAATPAVLKSRPEDVVKLLRAHRRAIAFLQEHPDEANALLVEAFQIRPLPDAAGRSVSPIAVVQEARKRLGWSARLEPVDLQFIQRLMDDSFALGFMGKRLKVDQVVDATWLQRAEQPAH
jgi:NitT/TauT family transport system substrate-binding protein